MLGVLPHKQQNVVSQLRQEISLIRSSSKRDEGAAAGGGGQNGGERGASGNLKSLFLSFFLPYDLAPKESLRGKARNGRGRRRVASASKISLSNDKMGKFILYY